MTVRSFQRKALMQLKHLIYIALILLLGAVPIAGLIDTPSKATAQGSPNVPIEFSGTVESVDDTTGTLIIGGFTIDITLLRMEELPEPGDDVTVVGFLQPSGEIVVVGIFSEDDDVDDRVLEIEGSIEAIDGDTITVNGLIINAASLSLDDTIAVGVVVVIEIVTVSDGTIIAVSLGLPDEEEDDESTPEPNPVATEVPTEVPTETPDNDDENPDYDDVIIVIEGPVQAVNLNVIVIYGFEIELAGDVSVLAEIEIGDYLRIEGTLPDDDDGTDVFEFTDGPSIRIVLVVINITIIDIDVNSGVSPPAGNSNAGDNDDDDDD